jgi:3-hydroxymyristoyl/3-hydroxydecanoyl-(acyl carrier protein) dehydratase
VTIEDLIRESCRAPLLSASERQRGLCLDGAAVATLLAQRGSSLFVDRITHIQGESNLLHTSSDGPSEDEPAGTIVCRCDLGRRAPHFAGRSPEEPLWPAVLQFEAIGQAGTCLYRLLEMENATATAIVGRAQARALTDNRTQVPVCAITDNRTQVPVCAITASRTQVSAFAITDSSAQVPACVLTDILAARVLRPVVAQGEVEIVARVYRDGLFVLAVGQCLKDDVVCSVAALRGIELEVLA